MEKGIHVLSTFFSQPSSLSSLDHLRSLYSLACPLPIRHPPLVTCLHFGAQEVFPYVFTFYGERAIPFVNTLSISTTPAEWSITRRIAIGAIHFIRKYHTWNSPLYVELMANSFCATAFFNLHPVKIATNRPLIGRSHMVTRLTIVSKKVTPKRDCQCPNIKLEPEKALGRPKIKVITDQKITDFFRDHL